MGTLSITTNTSALNVQRNLSEANDRSASSLAKLSSGSRVPTARDDAASLAIGSRLEAEVAGLNQASINASQATSMLQIADGALSQVNDILVRLKSLSVQSSSGQLSDSERVLLDAEFQQLKEEIDRISQDTEFNGNQLLNGGDIVATTNEIQTGSLASVGMAISYDTNTVVGTQDVDGDGTVDNQGHIFDVSYDSGAGEILTLTNRTTGEIVQKDITAELNAIAGNGANLSSNKTLDVSFGDLGVTITLNEDFDRAVDFNNNMTATFGAGVTTTGATVNSAPTAFDAASLDAIRNAAGFNALTNTLTLNITDTGAAAVALSGIANIEISVDGAPFGAAGAGVANIAAGADLVLRDATTGAELFSFTTGALTGTNSGANTIDIALPNNMWSVQEDTVNTATFSYQIGTGTKASDSLDVSISGASTSALGINASNISTQAAANNAINEIGNAIDTLQDVRAQVGASLSRLDFASSNLSVTIENSESAKSGLLDVDIATETTKYTAEQVIVQAGVSLLAQANQRPNTLLQLLQQ